MFGAKDLARLGNNEPTKHEQNIFTKLSPEEGFDYNNICQKRME